MMDPTFQNYKCSIVLYFVLHSFIPKIELVVCNALKICPESHFGTCSFKIILKEELHN